MRSSQKTHKGWQTKIKLEILLKLDWQNDIHLNTIKAISKWFSLIHCFHQFYPSLRKFGAREMAECLRGLTALSKDMWFPAPTLGSLQLPVTLASKAPKYFFQPPQHLHSHAQMHTQTCVYIVKKYKSLLLGLEKWLSGTYCFCRGLGFCTPEPTWWLISTCNSSFWGSNTLWLPKAPVYKWSI